MRTFGGGFFINNQVAWFRNGNSGGGLFFSKSTVEKFQKLKSNLTFAAAILAARCTRHAWKNLGLLPFFHA